MAALNTTYFANFGAELAVVSMLPMFFEETWGLTATTGTIASTFAFVNLFARPMGGLVSDRFGNRRFVMLAYMLGIAVGCTHGPDEQRSGRSSLPWPSPWAARSSCRVQKARPSASSPRSKRRLTGQISGMAGAYGNVGAVFYLLVFMFVTPSQFFLIIAGGAFIQLDRLPGVAQGAQGGFGDSM